MYLGTKKEGMKKMQRLFKLSDEKVAKDFDHCRGRFYDCLPDHYPVIWIDSDLPWLQAMATIAHEASHAVEAIAEFVGIDDRAGEFQAHGIAAVVRAMNKKTKTRKKKRG